MVAAFCRATQAKAASGHSVSPISDSSCPGAALQSVLSFYAGPCGGEDAWDTNGHTVGQDGMSFTMNLQYAAGHTGTFEMAYSCGDTTENGLAAVRCCLSNRVSAAAGLGVGGQGGRGSGCGCGGG